MGFFKTAILSLATLNLTLPANAWAAGSYDVGSVLNRISESNAHSTRFDSVWFQVRASLPRTERTFIDTWVLLHPDFIIPSVEAVKLRTGPGDQALRFVMQVDQDVMSMEFKGLAAEQALSEVKLNGVRLSAKESQSVNQSLIKYADRPGGKPGAMLVLSQAPLSVDFWSFKSMSRFDRANYFVNRRLLWEAAERVRQRDAGKPKQASFWSLFAPAESVAAADGTGNCARGESVCSPLLYGVNSTTGKSYCANEKNSCAVQSPLRKESLKADAEVLIPSILQAQGKSTAEVQAYFSGKNITLAQFERLEQTLAKGFNASITEATKMCENKSAKDSLCEDLIQRRVNFNSYLVDLKAQAQQSNSPSSQVAINQTAKLNLIDVEPSKEACNWYCRNKNWAYPAGIVGATFVAIAGICATKKVSVLGLCTKKVDTTVATATAIPTTVTATAPVAPTAADYTGVK